MEQLTLCAEGFRAPTLAEPEKWQGWPENVAACGAKCAESSEKQPQSLSLSKTLPGSALMDSTRFSQTLTRSGSMQSGTVSPALPLVRLKCGIESMLWPTPVHSDTGGPVGLGGGSAARKKLDGMVGEANRRAMCSSGLNPRWTEWLMGFPVGWTDAGNSETP